MKLAIIALTVVLVLCLAGMGLLIDQTAHLKRNSADAGGSSSSTADGEFTPLPTPLPAPAVRFATLTGDAASLADFRGHMILVNLWATWCGPCVAEMPSLDRLQAKMGNDLTIVAISQDRDGAAKVAPFVGRIGLRNIVPFLDPGGAVAQAFSVEALPTTILIDRKGRILGQIEGAADWTSPAMVALLRHYIDLPDMPPPSAASLR